MPLRPFDFLRSTRFKMAVAHAAYRALRLFGVRVHRRIRRRGVNYVVDLSEGMDLSLFLFGKFQHHRLPPLPAKGPVVLDVGANIGSFCLPLARRYPAGTVFAFEPTDYAFAKLSRNIGQNPDLAGRIRPLQVYVGAADNPRVRLKRAFSSWKIDSLAGIRHSIHLGIAKPGAARTITVDGFMRENCLERLDLLKIDTDGEEWEVLQGAAESIRRFRPFILMEITTYLVREKGRSVGEFVEMFRSLKYGLRPAGKRKPILPEKLEGLIPDQGSLDVLAFPIPLRK